MIRELLRKIEKGLSLTEEEVAMVEKIMAEEEQEIDLNSLLSEQHPGEIWRRELDARIDDITRKRRLWGRPQVRLALSGALAAAAVAAFVLMARGRFEAPGPEQMLQWHEEAVASTLLPGDGANLGAFSTMPCQPVPGDKNDPLCDGSLLSL
ncbi:MAG: hypothetical protein ACR2HJ_07285 [Fimbriimonadales bacterium]